MCAETKLDTLCHPLPITVPGTHLLLLHWSLLDVGRGLAFDLALAIRPRLAELHLFDLWECEGVLRVQVVTRVGVSARGNIRTARARRLIFWRPRKKVADLDLPHNSQEKCVPRGVSKVCPISPSILR